MRWSSLCSVAVVLAGPPTTGCSAPGNVQVAGTAEVHDMATADTKGLTVAADLAPGSPDAVTRLVADGPAARAAETISACAAASEGCVQPVPAGMVWIRAGNFWMGCANPKCKETTDENPVHLVWLSGYAVDLFETTVAEYAECVGAGACGVPAGVYTAGPWFCQALNWGAPDDRNSHPINGISWKQATSYCKWRGKRLLSEAEWEKAARGGCEGTDTAACLAAARTYPWGEAPPDCDHLVWNAWDVTPYTNKPGCGGPTSTRPVGSKPLGRSPYGLWDMAGNIGEFVSDWYDPAYYGLSPNVDPKGPASGSSRVARGMSFSHTAVGNEISLPVVSVAFRQVEDLGMPWSDDWGFFQIGVRCAK